MVGPKRIPCVVDWNVLQGLGRDQDLPQQYACLVCEQALLEVLGKTEKRTDYLRKFQRWARKNHRRLFACGHVLEIVEKQRQENLRTLHIVSIIDRRQTRDLRAGAREHRVDWAAALAPELEGARYQQTEELRQEFVQSCRLFARTIEGEMRKHLRWSNDEITAVVKNPEGTADFVEAKLRRLVRPDWTSYLRRRPQDFAVVRWAWLMRWYGLTFLYGRRRKPEKKPENNWDDAVYALVASYAGCLATKDKFLRETVEAIFPWVRLWPTANAPG